MSIQTKVAYSAALSGSSFRFSGGEMLQYAMRNTPDSSIERTAPQTSPIARGFGLVALAALCLAGAALAAFVAWFFISDMIGDWHEVNNPEIPKPGELLPSYWAEHSGFTTVLGFTVWFSPSLFLLILAFRFLCRAFAPFTR